MTPCIHSVAPTQMMVGRDSRSMQEVEPTERYLCAWAHQAMPEALLDSMPPWVARNAASGHLMQRGDCAVCPHYRPDPSFRAPPLEAA